MATGTRRQGPGSGEQGLGRRGVWGPPECVLLRTPTPNLVPGSPETDPDSDPQSLSLWGPQRLIPTGTPRAPSLQGHGAPRAWSLRRPPPKSDSYGAMWTSKAPFPWGSPKSASSWVMGTPRDTPAAVAGPLCPCPHGQQHTSHTRPRGPHVPTQMDWESLLGSHPAGRPCCAHPARWGLHPCPPYLLQPGGTARRDTGTVPLPCWVCKHHQHQPLPPDSRLGPPQRGLQDGPPQNPPPHW